MENEPYDFTQANHSKKETDLGYAAKSHRLYLYLNSLGTDTRDGSRKTEGEKSNVALLSLQPLPESKTSREAKENFLA